MSRLLLLSNSTMPGSTFFAWPSPRVKDFLGDGIEDVIFLPFAAVTLSYARYAEAVSSAFAALGYRVSSLHSVSDKPALVRRAEAIVVGGGNTFALLSRMYGEGLLALIRERVNAGIPYIGWSAGANLACPTLMTTNDMPVVQPPSFEALGLVPFQINPHYHELKFENQQGETRRERLEEFLVMNPGKKVVGLPEGMFLRREGDRLALGGEGRAKLYEHGDPVIDLTAGDVSYLLS